MNILVVRTDKLGDFITTLPAIYVLKKYDKKNKIIVCVSPINTKLALACKFIDEVIVDDGCSMRELVQKFKNAKVDVSITMFSNIRVALAQFLARIPLRIAPATKIAQIFYNKRVTQRRSQVKMAEFEYNLQLTKALFKDIDLSYKTPLLEVDSLVEDNKNKVCFHVGFGGSSDANWTLDEYEVLIKIVMKKYDVVLTFGPDEVELSQNMKNRFKDCEITIYISQNGLVEFARYISNFKLFISTSTGTYHLASLVGTPTLTFFADSLFASSARWKAVGDESIQEHLMIPQDKNKRDELFEVVKKELISL